MSAENSARQGDSAHEPLGSADALAANKGAAVARPLSPGRLGEQPAQ